MEWSAYCVLNEIAAVTAARGALQSWRVRVSSEMTTSTRGRNALDPGGPGGGYVVGREGRAEGGEGEDEDHLTAWMIHCHHEHGDALCFGPQLVGGVGPWMQPLLG